MSLRRQVYEWRNIVQNVGDSNFLNGYPISSVGSCITAAMPINQPVDIFIGGIGNNMLQTFFDSLLYGITICLSLPTNK